MKSSHKIASSCLAACLLVGTTGLALAEMHDDNAENAEDIRIVVSETLSLGDVLDAAGKLIPEQLQTQTLSDYAAATHRRSRGWLAEAPAVGLNHQFDDPVDDKGLSETELGIDLPLWKPGQRHAWRELASGLGERAAHYPALVRLISAGRVRDALWEVTEYRMTRELASEARQQAETLENKIRRLVELGEQPRTDLLLATQNTMSARQAMIDAQARLDEAETHYFHLTHLEQIPATVLETPVTGDIGDDHPQLTAARLQLEEARTRAGLARATANGQPVLSINTRKEAGLNGEEDQKSVGIGISLPLGGSRYSGAAAAEALQQAAAADTDFRLLRHQLADKLNQSRIEHRAATAAMQLAGEKLKLAEEQLALATRAYEAGEIDFIDLLKIQTALFEAKRDHLQLQARIGRAAAAINQASGMTP